MRLRKKALKILFNICGICICVCSHVWAYMPLRAHTCLCVRVCVRTRVSIRGQCRVSSTIILCFLRQTLSPDHLAPRFPLSTGIIGHASVPV